MHRLRGFDYKQPYFYMVTLKRLSGLGAFSRIVGDAEKQEDVSGRPRYLLENDITKAFVDVIRSFHNTWYCIEPITCFSIMPDHIHLLIKIRDIENRVSLAVIVRMLIRELEKRWGRLLAEQQGDALAGGAAARKTLKSGAVARSAGQHLFEFHWHDWIVKKDGQLAAFTRYIRENPERAWLRRQNRQYFGKVRQVSFLGCEWFAYGNLAILDLPVLMAVKGHRSATKGSPEWNALVEASSRIGPGGAGVGTFMSPLEKECGNAIAVSGGKWVVLSPEGFHDRWHPPREKERFCAEGRMLFLSLYASMDCTPTKQELYHRCHEMGDIVVEGLGCTSLRSGGAQHS
jgi:REP element-mobilizing transposase RayT